MTRTPLLAGLLIASLVQAHAAERPPPFPPDVIETMLSVAAEGQDPATNEMARQYLSMTGREDLTISAAAKRIFGKPTCEPLKEDGSIVDPVNRIADRTRDARIVIINEAHSEPLSRVLILDLLKPLSDRRFAIYAAETFMRTIAPTTPEWPLLADGFYSREPTFGAVVRTARALRYRLIPYEDERTDTPAGITRRERMARREIAQAQNITDRVLKAYPGQKAFVHAGHSHVAEAAIPYLDDVEVLWMAARLKAATGIDPLTIDQTKFRSPLDRPVVCVLRTDRERALALPTDITIGLPDLAFRNGRPAWRQDRGQRPIAIPKALRTTEDWSIVEARFDNEPDDATPIDRVLVGPNETLPLLLPPGRFRIEGWTRAHGWVAPVSLSVN